MERKIDVDWPQINAKGKGKENAQDQLMYDWMLIIPCNLEVEVDHSGKGESKSSEGEEGRRDWEGKGLEGCYTNATTRRQISCFAGGPSKKHSHQNDDSHPKWVKTFMPCPSWFIMLTLQLFSSGNLVTSQRNASMTLVMSCNGQVLSSKMQWQAVIPPALANTLVIL